MRFWCMEMFSRRFWLGLAGSGLLCAGFVFAARLDWWDFWPGGGGAWLGRVALCLVLAGVVLPPVFGAGMFAGPRAQSQVAFVLSKPVSRAAYFWVKLTAAAVGHAGAHMLAGLAAWQLFGKGIRQVDAQFWMVLAPTMLWGWCGLSVTALLSSLVRSAPACGVLSGLLLLGAASLLRVVPQQYTTHFVARELSGVVSGLATLVLGCLNAALLLAGRRVFERVDL